jgi:hypothetical protein
MNSTSGSEFTMRFSIFRPNIDAKGRIIRGAVALALVGGAILAWPVSRAFAIALGISSGFAAFESLRGWCALRACGLKTRF